MAYDSNLKSSRFLQGRRYTHNNLSDSQESFTSVLDLNSNEIYVDQGLIPSNNLPFNSSGDHLSVYADPTTGFNVLKYWFRHKLTKSDLNNEVWFFLNPVGVDNGIGAQLIDSNQQVNFISPKYSVSSLSNSTVEDGTAGYGVKLYVSTNSSSPSASDLVQPSTYAFDFKNGVVQFKSGTPSSNRYVYISAYQYVGRTLSEQLDSSNPDSIQDIFRPTGSFYATTNDIQITGSLDFEGDLSVNAISTGEISLRTNAGTTDTISITNLQGAGSNAISLDATNGGVNISAGFEGIKLQSSTGKVEIGDELEVNGSVIIRGDLKVEGQTILQSQNIGDDSLIVSGAMSILKNQIDNQIRSASLNIENLGNIGDRSNNSVMDLGGF
tara:strand:- start:4596 stop:5741 length:1146 start_codon:yes stop_codon:yes gene_type:complete